MKLLALLLIPLSAFASPFEDMPLHDPGRLGDRKPFGSGRITPSRQRPAIVRIVPSLRGDVITRSPAAYLGRSGIITASPGALTRHGTGWVGYQNGVPIYLSDPARIHLRSARLGTTPAFHGHIQRDGSGRPAIFLASPHR